MVKLYNHQSEVALVDFIKGYEGRYCVSGVGTVVNVNTYKMLKPTEHNGKQPYYYVTLSKNGKTKKVFIHRLVAETFIPNPNNLPQVNHKDGNVHNNAISNLEWVTNRQNTEHAYKNHLRTRKIIWVFNGTDYIPLRKACSELELDYKKVHYRIHKLNWDFNRAIDFKGGGQYVMCETLPSSRNSFRSN
jgi:hypothetical protein